MRQKPSPGVIRQVAERLSCEYGPSHRDAFRSPLDELIFTILSQNTSDTNRDRAWTFLRRAFPTWKAVLEADRKEVAEAIQVGGLAQQKSARIQAILTEIRRREGRLSLDRLREESTDEVRSYLEGFKGIGPKTTACVLLFSLGRPVFPVDTHIYRITTRLGWLPERGSSAGAHRQLGKLIPTDLTYELHVNLIAHGRAVCRARAPRCSECVLLDLCPTGQERVGPSTP